MEYNLTLNKWKLNNFNPCALILILEMAKLFLFFGVIGTILNYFFSHGPDVGCSLDTCLPTLIQFHQAVNGGVN